MTAFHASAVVLPLRFFRRCIAREGHCINGNPLSALGYRPLIGEGNLAEIVSVYIDEALKKGVRTLKIGVGIGTQERAEKLPFSRFRKKK